ncbi:MAG: acyclic terpene utilization AtuA family protein, partial [Firmicutes bacterium]|nr:acyclic terpene utilization AtuA family protein [Bacillota bacterium]
MKTIRIGSGAGYGGDRIEPALDLIRCGNLDYIIFECLAERTIALAQQRKLKDPDQGYNEFLEYRFEQILPLLKEQIEAGQKPVKIITNMGAANPASALRAVRALACQAGFPQLRIAAVLGDDVTERLIGGADAGASDYRQLTILETGQPLSSIADRVVSANAYIGAE